MENRKLDRVNTSAPPVDQSIEVRGSNRRVQCGFEDENFPMGIAKTKS